LETGTQTAGTTGGDVLGAVAREHILERLREATRLAEGELPQGGERLRRLLEETLAQTEAWLLTRACDAAAGESRREARLACALLGCAGGAPVREFLLIPFGEVQVERPLAGGSFVFTRRHAESARRWFERMGRKLAIDYEHQSFDPLNRRADGLRPAAGWIGRLEVRDDGLWACDVSWTERAAELLRSGEYRYFSPVIFWTDEDHSDVAALGPVALTNDPAMRGVQPLAARRCSAPQAGPAGRAEAADGAAERQECEVEEAARLRAELEAASQEIALLRKQLRAQEADGFVERGLRLGKIVDSTSMDWREDYLRDPEQAESRLQRAPVLLPPGRLLPLDGRGQIVSEPAAAGGLRCGRLSGSGAQVEAADLAAYEQALAAGRVRRYGTA